MPPGFFHGPREGLYVKAGGSLYITPRYKIVREGFKQGGLWQEGLKNILVNA